MASTTSQSKETNIHYLHSLLPDTSLVDLLLHLGPEVTGDADVVRSLLGRFGITDANPPRDNQVVETMSILSRQAVEGKVMCDVGSLVRALSNFVRDICYIPMWFLTPPTECCS